ncbi:hypothetical protein BJ085DRAFT_18658 [Dimargaris cristalligena]|uniref:CsbD-like domain-containing protein n=1 Tax=Dimargaris cristalligena TaxID=215637 RepID=A0A4P9ZZP2_9FUNG|nr:hypothetical protein BJ085DRAFT_18658 [Dimargaris cristalligena]|eukprot:RKP39213.1 hypothetical protein BJ085DRAFT_18658 [Dimargaris cristalligena]
MSTDPSKTHGSTQASMGSAQQKVGETLGNENMQAKGAARNAQGQAEHTQAKNQGYMEGLADKVSGAVKSTFHSMTGNQTAEAADEAQRAKGAANMNINK